MTNYPFWGGPWDGDRIEYADDETPDRYLGIFVTRKKTDGTHQRNVGRGRPRAIQTGNS